MEGEINDGSRHPSGVKTRFEQGSMVQWIPFLRIRPWDKRNESSVDIHHDENRLMSSVQLNN